MKKYPLGFAIIEWHDEDECVNSFSKAIIQNDDCGYRMFICANWISNKAVYFSNYEHLIKNVITDFDEIVLFLEEVGELQ